MSDESSKSTQSFIGRLALSSDDPVRPRQNIRRNPYDFRYFDRAQYRLGFPILDCSLIGSPDLP